MDVRTAHRPRPSRGSFADRAAHEPDLGYDDDLYTSDRPSYQNKSSSHKPRQNTSAHRMREPQAALHVPKPRNYLPESDLSSTDQNGAEYGDRRRTRPTVTVPKRQQDQPLSPAGYTPSDQSNRVRKGSLQDRSPLQKLEGKLGDISKEEKRARIEEAEYRARQKAGPHRGAAAEDGRRYHSDGAPIHNGVAQMRTSEPRRNATDPHAWRSRHVYDDPEHIESDDHHRRRRDAHQRQSLADDGRKRFSQASEALRAHSNGGSNEDLEDEDFQEPNRRNSNSRYYAENPVLAGRVPGRTSDHMSGRDSQRASADQRPVQENISRSDSKRLQKKQNPAEYPTGQRHSSNMPDAQQQLQTDRIGINANANLPPDEDIDLVPAESVMNKKPNGPTYQIPPQTTTSVDARSRLEPGFDPSHAMQTASQPAKAHLQSLQAQPRRSIPSQTMEEWRSAGTAKLDLDDLALDEAIIGRRDSRSRNSAGYDGASGDSSQGYKPSLFVTCGPLLRYTGLRRERRARRDTGVTVEREIWRGSVMIVTDDQRSSYSAPTLRLFAQPMELLPSLPADVRDDLPSDYVDPVAGQVKPSQTGRSTYVKPIESIPESVDLSQKEVDEGLFETYRSSSNKSRMKAKDGEKIGRFREVKGARLHSERGLTFWRFNIEVELGITQARIAYRINNGPATGFWVPARGHTMNIMFHSCNGFSLAVNPDTFSGPDPLWRDVLNSHAMKPYHVMIGGGDQIYNDRVTVQTTLFKEWLAHKNPEHKYTAEFTKEMQDELENFYLRRYSMWFSQGMFGMANSQIPMVNLWDDHDIIDGYGSYPHHFMSSKVFTGLGAVAFKYYMLFQHQSVSAETFREEPSWVLGASPGPYIHQHSRSIFMFLGRRVAFLGLDCRTERRRDEVMCQGTYDLIFNRCRAEIIKGETRHLIVLLTVPIAYPRLNFLENVLTSRVMDPIKAIGRTGALGGFINKFDGGVEILDDLDDHWTAKHHKQERNWFIQELQELAAEKSVRITILGGDVHLGAIGQFFSPKKLGIPKDQDHRYMPNVVSSAIVNTPPPNLMSDILNRRNKIHHLDDETDEDMIQMFGHDVDGKPRKNKTLLPRRNYCTIREYIPGSTPPHSPTEEQPPSPERRPQRDPDRRKYPPGSMGRARSLTREDFRPRNLIRRLSGSRSRDEPDSLEPEQIRSYEDAEPVQRRFSIGGSARNPRDEDEASYFPQRGPASGPRSNGERSLSRERPTNMFRRRPTDLSDNRISNRQRAADENSADEDDDPHAINLEGGLDICLNMEVSQQDPSGITVPYRLLVPALFYSGPSDVNTTRFKTRRNSLLDRIRGRGASRQRRGSDASHTASHRSGSRSPSPSAGPNLPPRPRADSRPIHPDDRLQFADNVPSRQPSGQDPRRDSRVDGTIDAKPAPTNNITGGIGGQPQGKLRKDAPPIAAPSQPIPQHPSSSHAATAPLPPQQSHYSDDDDDDDGASMSTERPRRRFGLLGSIKRRFSRRNRGRGGYDDDELSDDPDMYSYDSQSDGGEGGHGGAYVPATRPPNAPAAQQGQHQHQHQHQKPPFGPYYRAPEEMVLRNDGRLPSAAGGAHQQQAQAHQQNGSAGRHGPGHGFGHAHGGANNNGARHGARQGHGPDGTQAPPAAAHGARRQSVERKPVGSGNGVGSGGRHSGSAATRPGGGGRADPDDMTEDGGSMTFSDLESLEGKRNPRRQSKAERFFGTGGEDDGGRRQQQQQQQQQQSMGRQSGGGYGGSGYDGYGDDGMDEEEEQEERKRRRGSWKIWKRSAPGGY